MEPKPADFITEAKYYPYTGLLKIYPIGINKIFEVNNSIIGHFIAAAVNEKIQREKGEDKFLDVLNKKIDELRTKRARHIHRGLTVGSVNEDLNHWVGFRDLYLSLNKK